MRRRTGPLTITTGPTGMVVASTPWALNSSVHAASTAASTTGRYSGRQPASTALIATFSTVHSTRSGGTTATMSSGGRRVPASIAQHARLRRRHDGSPSVHPRSNMRLDLVLERRRARRAGCAAGGPRSARRSSSAIAGSSVRDPQPGRNSGRSAPRPATPAQRLPARARPAHGPFVLRAALDAEQGRDGVDVEPVGQLEPGVVVLGHHVGTEPVEHRPHQRAGRAVLLDHGDQPVGERHRAKTTAGWPAGPHAAPPRGSETRTPGRGRARRRRASRALGPGPARRPRGT